MTPESLYLWIVFNLFVLGMLALDLLVFHREAHTVSLREAFTWSVVWIFLAMLFNLGIYYMWGSKKAMEFLAGYLIEKSLSVDNIFVFIMIFSYFAVPPMYQHRILFWGILGALVMRAIFIAAGAALLSAFHWIVYIFGGFLVFTGIKMFFAGEKKLAPEKNPPSCYCGAGCRSPISLKANVFLSALINASGPHRSSWFCWLLRLRT